MSATPPGKQDGRNSARVRLPDISTSNLPGVGIINRAVSLTFAIIAAGSIVALLVAFNMDVNGTIHAEGVLRPLTIAQVHSYQAGIVRKVLVVSGDRVVQGQPLIVLDSIQLGRRLVDVRSEIAANQNDLDRKIAGHTLDSKEDSIYLIQAETGLIKSEAAFRDRASSFFPHANLDSLVSHYVPGENVALDYALSDIHSARENIRLKKLDIQREKLKEFAIAGIRIRLAKLLSQERSLEWQLRHIVLVSPISGTVISEGLGNLAGTYVSRGERLVDVARMDKWQALLFVEAKDLNRVKREDKIRIRLAGFEPGKTDDTFDASIVSIAEEPVGKRGEFSAFSGLYEIVAILNTGGTHNPRLERLKDGYPVNGLIATHSGRLENVILRRLQGIL